MSYFTNIFLTLVLFVSFTACEKENYGLSKQKDLSNFDVTWTDEAVYFDESTMTDLIEVDTTNFIYYFDHTCEQAEQLEEGDILVLHGLALRRVSSVTESQDQIVVNTEYATLNEAISEGVVEWNHEINFEDPTNVPELIVAGQTHHFKSVTDDSFTITLKLGSYDYKITLNYQGDKAEVLQEIERKIGNTVGAKFYCNGVIEKFRTSNKIEFSDSRLSSFNNSNDGLKGELTVGLIAAGGGMDNLNIEFPATLMKFTFMVGPIPISVNVKIQFVANAVVPMEGSSQVEAKFTYSSATGFGWSSGSGIVPKGDIGSYKIKKEKAQTGAASAISVNFGLGFPRLEIGLFGQMVVPWIQTAYLVGGDFTFNPACQQAKAAFIGACGYEFSFFGLFSYSGNKTLWNVEEVLLQSGDCDTRPSNFNEMQSLLGLSVLNTPD